MLSVTARDAETRQRFSGVLYLEQHRWALEKADGGAVRMLDAAAAQNRKDVPCERRWGPKSGMTLGALWAAQRHVGRCDLLVLFRQVKLLCV